MGRAPGNHEERQNAMPFFKNVLRPILPHYLTLKAQANAARHVPDSRFSRAQVRSLLDKEINAVRDAVVNNLPP
jgi:hypothetical protein